MRRARPRRRTAPSAVLALSAALVTTVLTAGPASAEEVYDRPADGVFTVEGHGWGHGHGLSQWGAQGAASIGVDAETIVRTYYPGTAREVLPDRPIRVWLQADEGRDTQVVAAPGLTVTDLASGTAQALPDGPTRWRATVDSAGLHLSSLAGGTWTPFAMGAATAFAGPLRFSGPTFVQVVFPDGTSRDYRGAVQAVKTSSTSLLSVDVLSLEDYLLGVVPRESSSSWKPAALQAQSIAARSYSAYKRAHVSSTALYDICDTTQCQVFGGSRLHSASGNVTNLEPTSTTEAVRATAGVVRTYDGGPIFAEFSSSNGGWSTTGSQPYLVAQRDDWDGVVENPVHSWVAKLPATDVERRYPSVGKLRRIRVTLRDGNGDWGGRVKTVLLEGVDSSGAATSVSTTGAGVYNAHSWPASSDGMRSSWWHITASTASSVVTQSVAPRLVRPPGPSTGTLTVTVRNTGSTSWPSQGLHLAVASPPGQADALVGGSTRPGVYTGNTTHPGATSVAPGDVVGFRFALDAAGVTAGAHARAYRLRIGEGALFGATVSWVVQVSAAAFTGRLAARPAAVTAPSGEAPPAVFADGRTVVVPRAGSTTVRLKVTNTGNVTWPGGTSSPVMLGTSAPRNRSSVSTGAGWLSTTRAARMSGTSVAPSGTAQLDLPLHGAGQPVGVTAEAFEPLWSGQSWIDGAPVPLTVVRVDPAVSRLAGLDLAPAAALTVSARSSATAVLTVRLRNLGGSPWVVGKEWLATSSGKADPLRTSAWPYPTRPPAMSGNVSRPGVTSVYPGEIGEWRIPLSGYRRAAGTYSEAWQAIGPGGRFGPVLRTRVTVTS